jgi:hypothetical protein
MALLNASNPCARLRYSPPMVGDVIHRGSSEALPLEWRLQALVAACNAIPVLILAITTAVISFVGGIVTGGVLWFVGGAFVLLVLGYAIICVLIAIALWLQKRWARYAAFAFFLLYIFIYLWANSVPPREVAPGPTHLRGRSVPYTVPAPLAAAARAMLVIVHLLPIVNAAAMAHLVLRRKEFSQSAKPSQSIALD